MASYYGYIKQLVRVTPPYRLDLTVAVLRRFSTNAVDVVAPDGRYVRALGGGALPVLIAVCQRDATTLEVTIDGCAADGARERALVRRMLGTERTTPQFSRAAAQIAWLRDLAQRVRGVRPPRYPTLWEAAVNAITFQHVSLQAATAILRRTILALGTPVEYRGATLYAFPEAQAFLDAPETMLRAAGLSAAKVATLRRVGSALLEGMLDEAMLEERTTVQAAELLCTIKGVGPWTAAVILLRGLARLDAFPMHDSGVARSAAMLGGEAVDLAAALSTLGNERGMLYYHLLLGRLIAAGEVQP